MKSDDPYESFLDGFGEKLQQSAPASGPAVLSHRSRQVAVLAAFATVAALAATAIVVLPRSGSLNAVALAKQALQPNGQILHTKITTRRTYPWRAHQATSETWVAEDPTRWRSSGWWQLPGFDPEEPIEQTAYGNGKSYRYFPYYDTLRAKTGRPGELQVTTDLPRHSASAHVPSLLPFDPERLLPMLERGQLRDAGETVFEGQRVRRFVGKLPHRSEYRFPPDETARLSYFADARSFAPLGGKIEYRRTRGPKWARIARFQFIVETYERLPDDAAHARLLEIRPPPGTKVVVRKRQRR